MFVEAQRLAAAYPSARFPDPAVVRWSTRSVAPPSTQSGAHFESAYYLTLSGCRRPRTALAPARWLFEGPSRTGRRLARAARARSSTRPTALRTCSTASCPSRLARDERDAHLPALDGLDPRHTVESRKTPIHLDALLADEAADRRARADARPRAPAHADRPRLPGLDLARHARRAEPAGLSLPLGQPLPLPGQDRKPSGR